MHKCLHLKQRMRKGQITLYCSNKKQFITFDDCRGCQNKCYKEYKPMKQTKVSKRAKACDISQKTKEIVWERDSGKCIYCDKPVVVFYANSHYIKRSQNGLGIPENVVTACPDCHYQYDFGTDNEKMIRYTKAYLSRHYEDWCESKLVYRKWSNNGNK